MGLWEILLLPSLATTPRVVGFEKAWIPSYRFKQKEKMTSQKVSDSPIHVWFELSYSQYLTVPRLVMESMPLEWQEKMAGLLREMDETFDWRPKEGRYWVMLKDENGRYTHAPLHDYRHGSCEHLRTKK